MGKKGRKGKFGKKSSSKTKRDEEKAKAEAEAEMLAVESENPFFDPNRSATGVLLSRPTARDIKIGSFSLTLHGRELIQDTLIELTIGRRYGLIGVNGCGKSTFLKALANRDVPIPEHVDMFLLHEEAAPLETTALEYVVEGVKAELARLEKLQEDMMLQEDMDEAELEDIMERIDNLDPANMEAKAGRILFGLGFTAEMMGRSTKDMSGGWRMRVALARALFVKPTILLLDEPTNHLDLESCVWLEEYLKHNFTRCLIVVSHSQDFLNGVCNQIMHVNHKRQLDVYGGNYDTFIRTKKEQEVNQAKRYEKEQADIKHIKQFIASCGTYSNLVKQAKSKQKIIDKMVEAGLTEPVYVPPSVSFRFPGCAKLPPPVLAFTNVAFSYSGKMEDALYSGLELGVDCDSRIALVGPNGVGKSTLLKLMLGELVPIVGNVSRHQHLKIARYHQHSADALDQDLTPLEFMRRKYEHLEKEETEWRQVVGRFGITGDHQTTEIGKLSDGQQSRIVFACMSVENPNMIFLDEPTNHLDIESIDALAEAINEYEGGMMLVSHDFRLINQVAKTIWLCENKTVRTWEGDIRAYKEHLKASWDEEARPTSV